MQRLVAVGFGDRDVVLETPRYRLVEVVHHAQGAVAGIHVVDDDADGEDVEHFLERVVLVAHLAVDAVQPLLASGDAPDDACGLHARADRLLDIAHGLAAVAAGTVHRAFQYGRAPRVLGGKAEGLQFAAHGVHAQALRDGGVDLEGFLGDAAALVRAHHAQGAHVVQAVGQLDQDHPDIAGDRQHHLAEVLRLRLGLGLELQVGELGDAVHQLRDLLAELGVDAVLAGGGVLHHVMQDGGADRLVVHPHLGHGAGHGQGVIDVGFAGLAGLAFVGFRAQEVGAINLLDLFRLEIGLELGTQIADQESGRITRCRRNGPGRGWLPSGH